MTIGGRSLCALRREGVKVKVGGKAETGWKVGRGMVGITNLGVPRETGPGGQRRRGLGAGRRGMVSVWNRGTWKNVVLSAFSPPQCQSWRNGYRPWMQKGDCVWLRSPGPKERNGLTFRKPTNAERGGTRGWKRRTSRCGSGEDGGSPRRSESRSMSSRCKFDGDGGSITTVGSYSIRKQVEDTLYYGVAPKSKTTRYTINRPL